MLIDHRPNNYNGSYKVGSLNKMLGDGGCQYETNVAKIY
jgi:hypothetical protein